MPNCRTRHLTVTNAQWKECAPFTYPESLRRAGIINEVTPIGVAVRPTRHEKLREGEREDDKTHRYKGGAYDATEFTEDKPHKSCRGKTPQC